MISLQSRDITIEAIIYADTIVTSNMVNLFLAPAFQVEKS